MKSLLKYFLVIVFISLVAFEIYLVFSLVGENIEGKREIEKFCDAKCVYSSNSYLWEFAGEGAVRGFTTKEECFNYCSKKEMGFPAMIKRYGAAFLSLIFFLGR